MLGTGLEAYHCLKFKDLRLDRLSRQELPLSFYLLSRATSGFFVSDFIVCVYVFGGQDLCRPG